MMIVAWDETRMRLYIFNEQERKKKKKGRCLQLFWLKILFEFMIEIYFIGFIKMFFNY